MCLNFNHSVKKTGKDIKIYFSTPNTKRRPPSVCYLQKLCNIFFARAGVRVLLIFNNSHFSHHFLITTPQKRYLEPQFITLEDLDLLASQLVLLILSNPYYSRRRRIPDLSQDATSYYQVHKIWQITKRHVLLVGSIATIQRQIEIFQVSLKQKHKNLQKPIVL